LGPVQPLHERRQARFGRGPGRCQDQRERGEQGSSGHEVGPWESVSGRSLAPSEQISKGAGIPHPAATGFRQGARPVAFGTAMESDERESQFQGRTHSGRVEAMNDDVPEGAGTLAGSSETGHTPEAETLADEGTVPQGDGPGTTTGFVLERAADLTRVETP